MPFSLPTLDEMQRIRRPNQKGESRLQKKVKDAKDETKAERTWKAAVWKRDGGQCRWCRRIVRRVLDLCPDRGEVHHVSGRVVVAIRWDPRNGILLCCACHERITGKVSEKHVIESKHTFQVEEIAYINADKPVKFKRVA